MSAQDELDRMTRIVASDGLHIERCLLALATGASPSCHDLDYAWRALIKLGHQVSRPADIEMQDAMNDLSSRPA